MAGQIISIHPIHDTMHQLLHEQKVVTELPADIHSQGVSVYRIMNADQTIGYAYTYPITTGHAYYTYQAEHGDTCFLSIHIYVEQMQTQAVYYDALQACIRRYCHQYVRVVCSPARSHTPFYVACQEYGFRERDYTTTNDSDRITVIMAINIRRSVRALLCNEQNAVLLMRVNLPERDPFWCTIGGRIELDERHSDTLQREIPEETGITDFSITGMIGLGEHTLI